jgi:predicted phage-related endonuclease
MWDYLLYDEEGKPTTVLEMKTTKRSEDWEEEIPEYYALQAALYAYLLGVDSVIMVASFLEDKDYKAPEAFAPSSDNTIIVPFKVSERYPNFDKLIKKAKKWWKDCVEGGVSPAYDEKKDADILKELRKNNVNPETDLTALIEEAEDLQIKLDKVAEETAADEKRLKTLKDQIKELSKKQFRPGDKEVIVHGASFDWVTSRSVTLKVDEDLMKQDGVLDKYKVKATETVKLVPKKRRE